MYEPFEAKKNTQNATDPHCANRPFASSVLPRSLSHKNHNLGFDSNTLHCSKRIKLFPGFNQIFLFFYEFVPGGIFV